MNSPWIIEIDGLNGIRLIRPCGAVEFSGTPSQALRQLAALTQKFERLKQAAIEHNGDMLEVINRDRDTIFDRDKASVMNFKEVIHSV